MSYKQYIERKLEEYLKYAFHNKVMTTYLIP